MTTTRYYFDHNGTSPLRPVAREAMIAAMDLVGNQNGVHAEGRATRAVIERARAAVAKLVGGQANCVTLTAGATEAMNMALLPDWRDNAAQPPVTRLLVGATEHPCVMKGHRFPADAVEVVPVRPDGRLDLDALDAAIARMDGARFFLALQAANNVTGVIQPVTEAAAKVHAAGGLMVVDAVQTAGKLAAGMEELGADLLVIAGHKLGGPTGTGALIRARESLHLSAPLIRGGGQEGGLRGGTGNVIGYAGLGAAAEEALAHIAGESMRLGALRDRLQEGLRAIVPDLAVFGADAARMPHTLAVAVPGVSASTSLMALDLGGLAVSAGSACSSGKVTPPSTLTAMGIPEDLALGLLRFSLGWTTTDEDVNGALEVFDRAIKPLRNRMRESVA